MFARPCAIVVARRNKPASSPVPSSRRSRRPIDVDEAVVIALPMPAESGSAAQHEVLGPDGNDDFVVLCARRGYRVSWKACRPKVALVVHVVRVVGDRLDFTMGGELAMLGPIWFTFSSSADSMSAYTAKVCRESCMWFTVSVRVWARSTSSALEAVSVGSAETFCQLSQ